MRRMKERVRSDEDTVSMGASLHPCLQSSVSFCRTSYSAGLCKSSACVHRKARLAPFCRVQSGLRSTHTDYRTISTFECSFHTAVVYVSAAENGDTTSLSMLDDVGNEVE